MKPIKLFMFFIYKYLGKMSKEGLNRISSINSELNEFTEDDGKKIYNVIISSLS